MEFGTLYQDLKHGAEIINSLVSGVTQLYDVSFAGDW